jgi:N-methylhydantoinase A/oxoprolinase/acetone carboxylase beta subunit
MVEIRTIGAGGGSIAKVLPGGRLIVGPGSAGARPGPACYGHGGSEPTVTDANVVLGRLGRESFLGGEMPLDVEAARRAIETHVALPLGLSTEAAAEGILAVTNGNLGAAIRLSLFEKGLDPREFVLLAFGGASGLHAVAVAEELGLERVVFPVDAATLSAFGILHIDLKHDLVRSRVVAAEPRRARGACSGCRRAAGQSQSASRRGPCARSGPRHRVRRGHALQGPGIRVDGRHARHNAGREGV